MLYTEHSWKNAANNTDGFIDIVLEDEHGTSLMIVECKRVLESSWIFLNADISVKNRRHAKAWVTCYISGNTGYFGWTDLALEPSCPESQYCVTFGQDAKSKPMLERVGAELVFAIEGLADEENPFHARRQDSIRIYFSVIVTTAHLKLCTFDPKEISLDDGKVSASSFQDVPYVRFRKQLSTQSLKPNFTEGLGHLVRTKEHTVFVVNAEYFSDFLKSFEIDDRVFRRLASR
ncbi:hypothetical protein D3871_08760 [Noviherbaspirillum saxi]|uniref:Uncharacterized protein n=1 Tax=Noviherbaspirillum saxi TaxID=2320863 RepID=A0A3A3GCH6_9BURK|nr:hypothetical protein D3871_08760 [Noviherbaspirillum saxi]